MQISCRFVFSTLGLSYLPNSNTEAPKVKLQGTWQTFSWGLLDTTPSWPRIRQNLSCSTCLVYTIVLKKREPLKALVGKYTGKDSSEPSTEWVGAMLQHFAQFVQLSLGVRKGEREKTLFRVIPAMATVHKYIYIYMYMHTGINIYNIPWQSYVTFLSDILSDILSGILIWRSLWHSFWHSI